MHCGAAKDSGRFIGKLLGVFLGSCSDTSLSVLRCGRSTNMDVVQRIELRNIAHHVRDRIGQVLGTEIAAMAPPVTSVRLFGCLSNP